MFLRVTATELENTEFQNNFSPTLFFWGRGSGRNLLGGLVSGGVRGWPVPPAFRKPPVKYPFQVNNYLLDSRSGLISLSKLE
jgi:hypothetical protein